MSIDEQFDAIVQKAITEMMAVKCPVADYQMALQGAIDEFQTALQASFETDGNQL